MKKMYIVLALISISLIMCEVVHMIKFICLKDYSVIFLKRICLFKNKESWTFCLGHDGVNGIGML